jgi:uncharacterized membrane protein YoaK (UPF0700 family)
MQPTATVPPSAPRVLLVLFALASGASDAFAFLLLGGIFTANMTGNLVLAAMFTRPHWPATLLDATVAVLSFAGAAYLGHRVLRMVRRPRPVALIAAGSGTAQLVIVVVWLLAHAHPSGWQVGLLLALSSAALGGQTVVAKRLSGAAGVTTTFVTGTLTSVMEEIANRERGLVAVQLAVIGGVVLGAILGTAVCALAPLLAPVVQAAFAISAVVVLLGRPGSGQMTDSHGDGPVR